MGDVKFSPHVSLVMGSFQYTKHSDACPMRVPGNKNITTNLNFNYVLACNTMSYVSYFGFPSYFCFIRVIITQAQLYLHRPLSDPYNVRPSAQSNHTATVSHHCYALFEDLVPAIHDPSYCPISMMLPIG